jgi:hypothetical protein
LLTAECWRDLRVKVTEHVCPSSASRRRSTCEPVCTCAHKDVCAYFLFVPAAFEKHACVHAPTPADVSSPTLEAYRADQGSGRLCQSCRDPPLIGPQSLATSALQIPFLPIRTNIRAHAHVNRHASRRLREMHARRSQVPDSFAGPSGATATTRKSPPPFFAARNTTPTPARDGTPPSSPPCSRRGRACGRT